MLLWFIPPPKLTFAFIMPSTISSKLLLCKTCKRLNRHLRPHASPHFLSVTCEDCNDVWFICTMHNRRWTKSKCTIAIENFAGSWTFVQTWTEKYIFSVAVSTSSNTINWHPITFEQQNGYKWCGHYYKHIDSINNTTHQLISFDNKRDLMQNALHYILLVWNLEEDNYTLVSNE